MVSPTRGAVLLAEALGLVLDLNSDARVRLGVAARVVGAEQQLTAAGKLHAEVGLRAATVATVQGREWRTRGNCSGHFSPHSYLVS